VVDTAKMTETELTHAYCEAILPSVFNKYQIRKVFGTNRKSGIFFGREQPALLVEGTSRDIYPHMINGKTVTIESFLEKLKVELGSK
jgi:hypothetical protein